MVGASWRLIPGTAAPVALAAGQARPPGAGFAVGDTAFASPTAGWAYLGDGSTAECTVLFTEDAGATWRPQLSWRGLLYGKLAAYDERRAAVDLAVAQGDDINGHRAPARAAGDPFVGPDAYVAGTEDAGATWQLAPLPSRQASGARSSTTRLTWLKSLTHTDSGMRLGLIRTQDGGTTWHRLDGMKDLPVLDMCFPSAAEGLLVTVEDDRADVVYRTVDEGATWETVPLAPPPGVPGRASTRIQPVAGRDGRVLLMLFALSRSDADRRPKWEGTYVYWRDGRGDGQPDPMGDWAGPYRLPMAPVRSHAPSLAAFGPDGRIWAAAGHELLVADDPAGPWQRRDVPLPPEQLITRIDPVADGVLWLTTDKYTLPGTMPGGQLYRSADDGAHWTRVLPLDAA